MPATAERPTAPQADAARERARAPPRCRREPNHATAKRRTTMSALARWDPFRALRRVDEVDDLFREFFQRDADVIRPAAEVAESDGEVTVKMTVPGVEKDQLQITVHDDILTVRGEMRKEQEEKKKNYYRQEIRYGAFHRTVSLPCDVDAAQTKAELKNGVLVVTLPKAKQPKAQPIKITAT